MDTFSGVSDFTELILGACNIESIDLFFSETEDKMSGLKVLLVAPVLSNSDLLQSVYSVRSEILDRLFPKP